MAKIKTIPERDVYGKGYKQEITLDNGKSYKIQTTTERDPYGDGYKKEIVSSDYVPGSFIEILVLLIITLIVDGIFIGGAFLFFKLIGY